MDISVRQVGPGDLSPYRDLMVVFAEAFEDRETYQSAPPPDSYVETLLRQETAIVLVALCDEAVIGGLIAYELKKFEQARSEVYIYDLAVADAHRRKGVATSLIEHLKTLAKERNAWVIYVQADYVDPPAVALYSKLGVKEEVLHFDIPVD